MGNRAAAARGKRGRKGHSSGGRVFVVLIALVVLILGGLGLNLWFYALGPGPLAESRSVLIPPKTGLAGIQRILAENGVVTTDLRFQVLARLLRVSSRLKAGEYLCPAGQTPYALLRMLESGAVQRRSATIPEGANLRQIADILAAGGWVDPVRFLALARDPAILARHKVPGESLEGYLFPDTYQFIKGQSAEAILEQMLFRGQQVRDSLGDLGDNPMGLSPHEVLTLASIVEKETGLAEERPLIARVFMNRLQKGMRLQTDPTVIYGIADFDGNLTRRHLETPTPYNTYVIKGLPPGPIASPGRAAISAVLSPASGDFLYFVSRNDGSHYFSNTLDEHNQAVFRYQKSPARSSAAGEEPIHRQAP